MKTKIQYRRFIFFPPNFFAPTDGTLIIC
jgi:hypothetical protein